MLGLFRGAAFCRKDPFVRLLTYKTQLIHYELSAKALDSRPLLSKVAIAKRVPLEVQVITEVVMVMKERSPFYKLSM